jgi:hypothetical protein
MANGKRTSPKLAPEVSYARVARALADWGYQAHF